MKKRLLTIFLLSNAFFLFSQSSINSGSKDVVDSNGSISFSFGQLLYTFNSSSGATARNGIQIPFEISTTLGINKTDISLEMQVFPNPTIDNLTLSLKNTDIKSITFLVHNILGEKLLNGKIVSSKTNISFKKLPDTVYFLTIFKNNKTLKTFKIIKK
jgi:hypothetical protein